MNEFTLVFLSLLAVSIVLHLWLSHRQLLHVAVHRNEVPEDFREKISLDAHQKAADYTSTKTRFGRIELVIATVILLAWTIGGGLNWLDQIWRSAGYSELMTGVGVIISAMIIVAVLELPVSAYSTFVIEEKFGFNKSTVKLFIADTFKQAFVMLLIGVPLVAAILWIMGNAGVYWWFYAWLFWMAFNLLMLWAYPAFIAPIFNKFSPLDDVALADRITRLMERCGFKSKGIFVMDGSRRSSHGNAYFTGLGDNKRIVFYDTLIKSLDPDEVEAVLAHELGHFKRKHITKRIVVMFILSLLGLALIGWLMTQSWFFLGLGVAEPSTYAALMLFSLVSPVFTFFLQPTMAYFSRKHEFEADDFAAQQTNAADLIRALVKLYEENANTLTPDPLYSAFHDSHPPASVRVSHLTASAH